ncbi:AraC family transcriptional regulator [Clostridium nigeriense]|uniref:AraC family transcriptional regulator n=1 Tax=Clostridium nigeriense TaxID=1805470 RepID=UPI00082B125C|nr:AraC family transcriptional regulator [Clostridium nigeriense]
MDNLSYLNLKEQVNHGNIQLPMEIYPVEYRSSSDFYSHWHDEMEFIYVLNGSSEICIDFKIFKISTGDFIIIPKGAIHYMVDNTNIRISYIALVFNLSLIEGNSLDFSQINFINPILQNKLFFNNIITCKDSSYDNIVNAFKSLVDCYKYKGYGYQLAIKSYLFTIFHLFFKEGYIDANIEKENYNNLIKIEKLKEVIKYIQTNYKSHISIKDLSNIAKYSEYHFLRFFKNETGKTCTQYINNFRIEKASLLLANTDLSITDIAYEVGFGDVSYFIKTFKKQMSISPTKYRKELFKNEECIIK